MRRWRKWCGWSGRGRRPPADPRRGARAVSHRQSVWTVRHNDARAIRNRVPGLGRRANVARLSLPLQTPRSEQAAWDLRTISAAFRLEFVVCLAELVAPGAHRRAHGAEFASRRCRRAFAFCRQSLSARAAAPSARRDLAILVHDANGKTFARHVVEKTADRPLRPDAGGG